MHLFHPTSKSTQLLSGPEPPLTIVSFILALPSPSTLLPPRSLQEIPTDCRPRSLPTTSLKLSSLYPSKLCRRILGALSSRQHTASLDSVGQPSPSLQSPAPRGASPQLCTSSKGSAQTSTFSTSSDWVISLESPTMTPPGAFPQLYLLICS